MKAEYKAVQKEPAEIEGLNQAAHECPTPNMGDNVCRPIKRSDSTKQCRACGFYRELSCFYKSSNGKLVSQCKECNILRSKKYYKDNSKEINVKRAEYQKQWIKNNRLKRLKYAKDWNNSNRELKRKKDLAYYYRHPKKCLANGAKYRARKLQATPKWLSKEMLHNMQQFYINCPNGYHVDHIIPLKGEIVCGLHVPWNLQIITSVENMKKSNKF